MVTASHNPPNDNGYKVYLAAWEHAVPDRAARRCRDRCRDQRGRAVDVHRAGRATADVAADASLDAYVAARAALAAPDARRPTGRVVLTPCTAWAARRRAAVLHAAGFAESTAGHRADRTGPGLPDRALPEPGRARARWTSPSTAGRAGADIVIANDPDADRAAVAAKDPDTGALAHAARRRGRRPAGRARRGAAGRRRRRAADGRRSPTRSCPRGCSRGSPPRRATPTRKP